MRNAILAAAIAGTLASPALAQDHDAQLWVKADARITLSDTAELRLETNQRISDDRDGLYESQYLAALRLTLAEGLTLTGGLNRVVNVSDGSVSSTEWRPRQEIGFPIAELGTGELKGRVRFEQRFRSDTDDVGHRVRPEISYELPLGDTLDLEIGHESYFNLNTTDFGQQSGHERMRNFAALGFPLADRLNASIGYLNQYRFNRNARDQMEHALTTEFSVSF